MKKIIDNTKLETYAKIYNYMGYSIQLLESVGDIEKMEEFKEVRQKYYDKIINYMKDNNLSEIELQISKGYAVKFTYNISK